MRATPYTDEELAWIKSNRNKPQKTGHVEFCAKFSRADVTLSRYKSLLRRENWLTGRSGQFKPGRSHSWQRKFRGQRGCNGTERVFHHGFVYFFPGNPEKTAWADWRYVPKHRYLWEQINGPVPDGMCLKCLDGNRTNTDPGNWEAIPRAMLPRLNGRYGRNYDNSPPELKPLILEISRLEQMVCDKQSNLRQPGSPLENGENA